METNLLEWRTTRTLHLVGVHWRLEVVWFVLCKMLQKWTENWARTYSFCPRKMNFTSKSAEFNFKFNCLVYYNPGNIKQRKNWWIISERVSTSKIHPLYQQICHQNSSKPWHWYWKESFDNFSAIPCLKLNEIRTLWLKLSGWCSIDVCFKWDFLKGRRILYCYS